ncbi:MAG: glycosyltransferase family 2 protein, partial [bacterium]
MKKIVSIVVPVYFNEGSLPILINKFEEIAAGNSEYEFEFIFVDDYSKDNSYKVLLKYFYESKFKVKLIQLSKNHGSFTACVAGLSKAAGDCAIIIAADLQDPPELITEMLPIWKNGTEVVMAARNSREDPLFSKVFSKIYYTILRKFALKEMPEGGFDFVLIDRKVINIICDIKEKNTSLMGLILWIGFKREIIYYDRKARQHGKSMWTFTKKFKYFIDSFIAFSFLPIRLSSVIGFTVSILGFLYTIFLIYDRLINKNLIQGITALIVIVLFLGGIQLIILGIFGEYVWRILDESRKRPVFIIDAYKSNEKLHDKTRKAEKVRPDNYNI